MKTNLFDLLRKERALGRMTTFRDWLGRNPPPASAFTQTLADVARRVGDGAPFLHAVREFLDEFGLRPEELRLQAIVERPTPTGDRRYDAYLGALAEHLALGNRFERSSWASEPTRFLEQFWFVSEVKGFRAIAIAQSPAAFRRRGIFITHGSLVRY